MINNYIEKNREHYNKVYSAVDIEPILDNIKNIDKFLDDACATDTSWHGMYQENFAERIVNKKVLELGSGDGLNSLIMAVLGAEVSAVDISDASERIIREISSIMDIKNIKSITGDFAYLQFGPKYFDFIIGKSFLHHLDHDLEKEYLRKCAVLLKKDGEARFFEPAVNSKILDMFRWMVPVPGRPSILSSQAFAKWKEHDPHPPRDNSSRHFVKTGKEFFQDVEIIPIGSIERFHRLIPNGNINRRYRRWAHFIERYFPLKIRWLLARSQLIIYRLPKL